MISDTVSQVLEMLYNDIKKDQTVIIVWYIRDWIDVKSFVQASSTKTIDMLLLREEVEGRIKRAYTKTVDEGDSETLKDMLGDL